MRRGWKPRGRRCPGWRGRRSDMAAAKPTDLFPREAIPAEEMARTSELILGNLDLCQVERMVAGYEAQGLALYSDALSEAVPRACAGALREGRPLSVIRLGDGEFNLLSFDAGYGTPQLDRYCVAALLDRQEDSFLASESWMLALREMMLGAALQADIVGVLGLWRPQPASGPEAWARLLETNPRGAIGQWRGLDYGLQMARRGMFGHATLASAHLYFGMLEHLDLVMAQARRVLLVTSRVGVRDGLRARYPGLEIESLEVGKKVNDGNGLTDSPEFLNRMAKALPNDLAGCCCLVGAGPWAEFYCAWIRQRGGVGIDLGSGFDLLAGVASRPIHVKSGLDKANPYAL